LFGAAPLDPQCRCVVVVPARNEQDNLEATLDALRVQVDRSGAALPANSYEVFLLLNNCTDASGRVAEHFAAEHPAFRLRVASCTLPPEQAHVGTARRWLMDAACALLEQAETRQDGARVLLSTDADTLVAADWIAENLAAVDLGADAVGGAIELLEDDRDALDAGTRLAYERDRRLQVLVARLESLLDPDPADPWPRHLEHFGASLACTCAMYRRAGGLPAVKPLEDVAFVNALRRVGARLRHSTAVRIRTSARLEGRAEVGLSGQLRLWQQEMCAGKPQRVDSAEWMAHRFRRMGMLRRLHADSLDSGLETDELVDWPEPWRGRLRQTLRQRLPSPQFLEVLDCDRLIEEMFAELPGNVARRGEIVEVSRRLERMIAEAEDAASRR
jgi:hypothetical protein